MQTPIYSLVSIVLCVYNGEQFLKQQLDSILNQSYTAFELLCVDDKSTDSSFEILKSYEQRDQRIRVVQNDTNLGFNKNFEKGISLSKGEFIAICDQDDIWYPNKIEELVANIDGAMLIYSNSNLIDEQNNNLNKHLNHSLHHVQHPSYKAFLDGNFITGHTCLFKKALSEYILPFPNDLVYYDWWICQIASYTGTILYYDKILTDHRVHTSSVIQQNKKAGVIRSSRNDQKYEQIHSFAEAIFVNPADRKFISKFLTLKKESPKNAYNFIKCYTFLLHNFSDIYPYYSKGLVSKLNFLRRHCI